MEKQDREPLPVPQRDARARAELPEHGGKRPHKDQDAAEHDDHGQWDAAKEFEERVRLEVGDVGRKGGPGRDGKDRPRKRDVPRKSSVAHALAARARTYDEGGVARKGRMDDYKSPDAERGTRRRRSRSRRRKRSRSSDSSRSGSSFRLGSSTRVPTVREITTKAPGEYFKKGLASMGRYLAASGGADDMQWDQVSVTAYLTQNVLGTRGGAAGVGERNARELRNLAEAIDCLRAGNLARAADILLLRFQAIEQAIQDGNWGTAKHIEAIGKADGTSAPDDLKELATRQESRRLKLEAGAARARG